MKSRRESEKSKRKRGFKRKDEKIICKLTNAKRREAEKGRWERESERVDRCGLTCLGQRQVIQLRQIHRHLGSTDFEKLV